MGSFVGVPAVEVSSSLLSSCCPYPLSSILGIVSDDEYHTRSHRRLGAVKEAGSSLLDKTSFAESPPPSKYVHLEG